MIRKCPHCSHPFSQTLRRSTEIDVRKQCGVMWRDPGDEEDLSFQASAHRKFVAASPGDTVRCPHCDDESLRLGSIGMTQAHQCSRCRGHLLPYARALRDDDQLGDAYLAATVLELLGSIWE